jgi:hypothetical protein
LLLSRWWKAFFLRTTREKQTGDNPPKDRHGRNLHFHSRTIGEEKSSVILPESQLFEDLSLFCIKAQKEGLDNKKEDRLQG